MGDDMLRLQLSYKRAHVGSPYQIPSISVPPAGSTWLIFLHDLGRTGTETSLLGVIKNVGEVAFATVLAVGHGSHEDASTALRKGENRVSRCLLEIGLNASK